MQGKINQLWNIPNILTLFRLLLIPSFVITFFYVPGENHLVPMIIFLVASLTDTLDGIIARATNTITQVGIVLDPLADKLLKIATLICFAVVDIIPLFLVITLIVIDIAMIIVGGVLFKQDITIPSNIVGKTGTFVTSVGLILCFFHASLNGWDTIVLYSGLFVIVASIIIYVVKNYKRVLLLFYKKNSDDLDKKEI